MKWKFGLLSAAVLGIFSAAPAGIRKNSLRSAPHPEVSGVRAVFADSCRSQNWERLYEMFEEEGAEVSFEENPDPDRFDALVIGGGYDIDPALYGEEDTGSEQIDREEDLLQIRAAKRFIQKGKPVFGVCRGAQILNVCLGGTLVQDMEGHKGAERVIRVSERSLFRDMTGEEECVLCWHHQRVDVPGEGLIVTMYDALDQGIEGFEHTSLPVYGIQWHPEGSSCGRQVIRAFLKEAEKQKQIREEKA